MWILYRTLRNAAPPTLWSRIEVLEVGRNELREQSKEGSGIDVTGLTDEAHFD